MGGIQSLVFPYAPCTIPGSLCYESTQKTLLSSDSYGSTGICVTAAVAGDGCNSCFSEFKLKLIIKLEGKGITMKASIIMIAIATSI